MGDCTRILLIRDCKAGPTGGQSRMLSLPISQQQRMVGRDLRRPGGDRAVAAECLPPPSASADRQSIEAT
jgi:hypothetical protein